jgi:hypothetical protein
MTHGPRAQRPHVVVLAISVIGWTAGLVDFLVRPAGLIHRILGWAFIVGLTFLWGDLIRRKARAFAESPGRGGSQNERQ